MASVARVDRDQYGAVARPLGRAYCVRDALPNGRATAPSPGSQGS